MDKYKKQNFSRRKFLGSGLLGAAGITVLPQLGKADGPESKPLEKAATLRLGFIGLGRQAMGILNGFLPMEGIEVVACSDVYGIKRERFVNTINEHYNTSGQNVKVEAYEDYKALLARPDIDAVVIAT